MGQLLSFNRKGLRLAEARHHRSSRLHLILDSVQMCCLVKIAHYATEPREESVARQVPLWELEAPVALAADLFNRAGMGWVEEPYRLSDAHRIRAATLWVPTFLSHGWWSPIRPSSSQLTITSSSFAGSTVLYPPVGFPKCPNPRRDLRDAVPGRSQRARQAVASGRGLSPPLRPDMTRAAGELVQFGERFIGHKFLIARQQITPARTTSTSR